MGKRFSRKKKERDPKTEQKTGSKDYAEVILCNAEFEKYYKEQHLLNDEEYESFISTLKTPLPVSFRITGSRNHAAQLKSFMKEKLFPPLSNIEIDGAKLNPPTSLPWYPDELGWVFECGRTALRRSPECAEFHQFLVSETTVGNISRQEAVSMIPVLLMDVKPGQRVLDMCAAPGSKTAQLLEGVVGDGQDFPDGLVIANDSDQNRAYMLVRQAKRLQTPLLIVTNHDAQSFPKILHQQGDLVQAIQFDRILCDVPCSGDGTMRKNKTIWKTWNSGNGNGLHPLQLSILNRGCELLKVGGRLVYSTCSFNPIENEAVVSNLLSQAKGAFKLIDVSHELPGLIRKPGITSWKVKSKNGEYHTEYKEGTNLVETMFAPKDINSFGMEKCLRIYPQDQNSGGFFVAVLEKVGPYGGVDRFNLKKENHQQYLESKEASASPAKELPQKRKSESLEETPQKKSAVEDKEPQVVSKESPFILLTDENPVIQQCCEFYGLDKSFPKDVFLVRNESGQDFRTIYVVSEKAKEVLQAPNANAIKFVNTGVKVFAKTGGKSTPEFPFRLCNEGILSIASFLDKERQVSVPVEDLVVMIKNEYPKYNLLTAETVEKFKKISKFNLTLENGSCLLNFDPTTSTLHDGSLKGTITLPCFKSHVSVSLLLDKHERKSLLNRLTGETLTEIVPLDKGNK